jgi:predicted RNA binding protein with dsRBD fold (UPF0201 family)
MKSVKSKPLSNYNTEEILESFFKACTGYEYQETTVTELEDGSTKTVHATKHQKADTTAILKWLQNQELIDTARTRLIEAQADSAKSVSTLAKAKADAIESAADANDEMTKLLEVINS